jgi:hypothetical protein
MSLATSFSLVYALAAAVALVAAAVVWPRRTAPGGAPPICASCRKVRDDGGYWGNVEEYFGSRAPVEFTHGICPECQVKLYPSIM